METASRLGLVPGAWSVFLCIVLQEVSIYNKWEESSSPSQRTRRHKTAVRVLQQTSRLPGATATADFFFFLL